MVHTLATRKQREAIRAEMCRIRSALPYNVDAARVQVKQLTDWKYHLRQHPLPILGVVALIGYLIVPSKTTTRTVFVTTDNSQPTTETETSKSTISKGGVVAGLLATAGSIALRSGTSLIMRHLSQQLMSNFSPAKKSSLDDSPRYADQAISPTESKVT